MNADSKIDALCDVFEEISTDIKEISRKGLRIVKRGVLRESGLPISLVDCFSMGSQGKDREVRLCVWPDDESILHNYYLLKIAISFCGDSKREFIFLELVKFPLGAFFQEVNDLLLRTTELLNN